MSFKRQNAKIDFNLEETYIFLNLTFKGTVCISGERLSKFEINSQSNHTLPFHAPELVCWYTGWNSVWFGPSHSVFFVPFTEPGLCANTRLFFFRAHSQNGQLQDREEQFCWQIILGGKKNQQILNKWDLEENPLSCKCGAKHTTISSSQTRWRDEKRLANKHPIKSRSIPYKTNHFSINLWNKSIGL